MKPFLTCSSLPHPLHRSAIRSPHRQPHRRWIWAIYAALKPSADQEPVPGVVEHEAFRDALDRVAKPALGLAPDRLGPLAVGDVGGGPAVATERAGSVE